MNSMACPLPSNATLPEAITPFCEIWTAPLTVVGLSGALANSVMTVLAGTLVAP